MAKTYPIVRMVINGETVEFKDTDVIDAETIQETSPLSIELPASSARVRIYLDDITVDGSGYTMRDKFSPFSDGIYYASLAVGLVVDIYEHFENTDPEDFPVDEDVTSYVGRFYLDEWNCPTEGEIEFVCIDAIGTLENKTYLGTFYATATTVSTIIASILDPVNVDYAIDAAVGAKKLKGYLPGNKTLRETLQQVLFAASAYATTFGSNAIKIHEAVIPNPRAVRVDYRYSDGISTLSHYDEALYSDQVADTNIPAEDKSGSQNLRVLPLVTAVELSSHDFVPGTIVEEIFSAELPEGDYLVVYPKPYHTVTATGVGDSIVYLATSNDEVLMPPDSTGTYPDVTIFTVYGDFEFGVNHVYLHIPAGGGTAVVRGYPYIDSTQVHSVIHPDGASSPPNVWSITDALLLPSIETLAEATENLLVLAPDVLAKLVEYANLRYQQNVTIFPYTYYDTDVFKNILAPHMGLEPGNIGLVDSLYGKDIVGIVKKMVSNLSSGYLIDTEFVGVERSTF